MVVSSGGWLHLSGFRRAIARAEEDVRHQSRLTQEEGQDCEAMEDPGGDQQPLAIVGSYGEMRPSPPLKP